MAAVEARQDLRNEPDNEPTPAPGMCGLIHELQRPLCANIMKQRASKRCGH